MTVSFYWFFKFSYFFHLWLHLFPLLRCICKPHTINHFCLSTISLPPIGDQSPPRCPSRQAWQTVGSQTSTGPQTAKRTARMAILLTALPTERTDTMAGQLHILERQVGAQTWRLCKCVSKHVHAALDQSHRLDCQTARCVCSFWADVISSMVSGKGS